MGSTSIGRGPASGGNENHQADPRHTTLGEEVQQEPPAGNRNDLEAQPPAPQAPAPAIYEAPIMSGEPNMSMAGGGYGYNDVPVQDSGTTDYYVWLPPELSMSSSDGY